jgi:DNA-binding NtrC family response regulator
MNQLFGLVACVIMVALALLVFGQRQPLTTPKTGEQPVASMARSSTHETTSSSAALDDLSSGERSLEQVRLEVEKHYLLTVLDRCRGNRTQAARISGVSRRTFYNLLQRHELER